MSFLCSSRILFQSVSLSLKSSKATFKFLKLCWNKFGLVLSIFVSFCNKNCAK